MLQELLTGCQGIGQTLRGQLRKSLSREIQAESVIIAGDNMVEVLDQGPYGRARASTNIKGSLAGRGVCRLVVIDALENLLIVCFALESY